MLGVELYTSLTHNTNKTHLYTSELLFPREEQEIGADGFQGVKRSLEALETASSLAVKRIIHDLIETHHAKPLSRIWLVGAKQSRCCGK